MAKPVEDWKEGDVLALPTGENDSFERKGSQALDLTVPGVKEHHVLDVLAKQLSAFSNTGGGKIIYGVADDGTVDNGGVALSIKGRQSTKEWLEDIIPTLTELEIVGFNVYPITPDAGTSTIAAGKALYVVDIPDSDRAPHQSKRDLRYYVRLGGKSQPAPHRMIEDIRNRQTHPLLQLSSIGLEIRQIPRFSMPLPDPVFQGEFYIRFHFQLRNVGRVMSTRTCLRLQGSPIHFPWRDYDNQTIHRRGVSTDAPAFWELSDPIYPVMEIGFYIDVMFRGGVEAPSHSAPNGGPWLIAGKELADVRLSWWLFADNAPVKHGSATFQELGFAREAGRAVSMHPQASLIRSVYRLIE